MSVLKDVLTVYGGGGKCIIFTQTKREADVVTAAISNTHPCEVRPVHGLNACHDQSTRVGPGERPC